jgi:hypothetical protein
MPQYDRRGIIGPNREANQWEKSLRSDTGRQGQTQRQQYQSPRQTDSLITIYQRQIFDARNRINDLQTTIQRNDIINSKLQNQIIDLKKNQKGLEDLYNDKLQQEKEKYNMISKKTHGQIGELADAVRELDLEREYFISENKKYISQLNSIQGDLDNLNRENTSLKQQLSNNSGKTSEQLKQLEYVNNELNRLKQEHQIQITNLNKQHEGQCAQDDKRFRTLQNDCEKIKIENDSLSTTNEEVLKQIRIVSEQLKNKMKEIEEINRACDSRLKDFEMKMGQKINPKEMEDLRAQNERLQRVINKNEDYRSANLELEEQLKRLQPYKTTEERERHKREFIKKHEQLWKKWPEGLEYTNSLYDNGEDVSNINQLLGEKFDEDYKAAVEQRKQDDAEKKTKQERDLQAQRDQPGQQQMIEKIQQMQQNPPFQPPQEQFNPQLKAWENVSFTGGKRRTKRNKKQLKRTKRAKKAKTKNIKKLRKKKRTRKH